MAFQEDCNLLICPFSLITRGTKEPFPTREACFYKSSPSIACELSPEVSGLIITPSPLNKSQCLVSMGASFHPSSPFSWGNEILSPLLVNRLSTSSCVISPISYYLSSRTRQSSDQLGTFCTVCPLSSRESSDYNLLTLCIQGEMERYP